MDLKDLEWIEKYRKGELSEKEVHQFESRLLKDSELSEFLELTSGLKTAFESKMALELKEELKNSSIKSDENKRMGSIFWVSVAATITLILSACIFLFFQNEKTTEEVFLAYYEPYPNAVAPVLRGEEKSNIKFDLYESEKYEEALIYFKEKEDDVSRFYTAQCFIATNKPQAALEILLNFNEGSEFHEASLWYTGLSWLMIGERNKAKQVFENLSSSTTIYGKKANQLLEALD